MHALSVGLLLALTPLAVDCSELSEFPIRRSSVMSSWQSSFGDGPTCFYSRSEADETSVLSSPSSSSRFVMSADKSESDEGFHWFAVQLKEPVHIRSVTVKAREGNSLWLLNRIIGVEVWTSNASRELFAGDHCNSRDMSRQFSESRREWRLCGAINRTLGSINSGEDITVPCDAEHTQYLLLRKNVRNKSSGSNDDDVMSFADLRLQILKRASNMDPWPRLGWSFATSFAFGFSAAAVSVGILIAALVLLGVIKCAVPAGGSQPQQIGLANSRLVESQRAAAETTAPGEAYENSDYKLEAAKEVYVT